jgi:hypothetical protein
MPKKPLAIGHPERAADLKVAEAILGLIAQVPNTDEAKSPDPGTRARAIEGGSYRRQPCAAAWYPCLAHNAS